MFMKWTTKKYPKELRDYPTIFKKKVIEIGNQLKSTSSLSEEEILEKSIKLAQEWAKTNGVIFALLKLDEKDSDEIFTVSQQESGGWVVKDGTQDIVSEVFMHKAEAIKIARELAKDKRALLNILSTSNEVLLKVSYHSRKKNKE
jgi:uncharacterized protein YdaT